MRANLKFEIILGVMILVFLIGGGAMAFIYFNKDTAQRISSTFLGGETVVEKTGSGEAEIKKVSETVAINNNGEETIVEVTAEKKGGSSNEQKEENELKTFAKSFTERFGSFSNQNDFENINNVMIYMTPQMVEESEKFIEKEKKNAVPGAYYGITTKVLNMEVTEFEGTTATAKVTAQRKETSGVPQQSKTFTQSADIKFKKEGGTWKVDEFNWL